MDATPILTEHLKTLIIKFSGMEALYSVFNRDRIQVSRVGERMLNRLKSVGSSVGHLVIMFRRGT